MAIQTLFAAMTVVGTKPWDASFSSHILGVSLNKTGGFLVCLVSTRAIPDKCV